MNIEKFVGLIILALSIVCDTVINIINFLFDNYLTVLFIIAVVCFIGYAIENPSEEIEGCRGVYTQWSEKAICCSDCKTLNKVYFKYNDEGWGESSCWCFEDNYLNSTVRIW